MPLSTIKPSVRYVFFTTLSSQALLTNQFLSFFDRDHQGPVPILVPKLWKVASFLVRVSPTGCQGFWTIENAFNRDH
jgi:hypothetical protein